MSLNANVSASNCDRFSLSLNSTCFLPFAAMDSRAEEPQLPVPLQAPAEEAKQDAQQNQQATSVADSSRYTLPSVSTDHRSAQQPLASMDGAAPKRVINPRAMPEDAKGGCCAGGGCTVF